MLDKDYRSSMQENDKEIITLLKKVNHDETYKRAHAERNILKVLEEIVKLL